MTRKKRRGRPTWKPTRAERSKARTLLGMGTSVATVAAILRVDAKTARKHLREEIRTAAAEADAAVLLALFKSATNPDRPNTRAAKLWTELRRLHPSVVARAVPSSPEGKKQSRKKAAVEIARSGRYAPGQAPRLAAVDGELVKPRSADDEPK